MKVKNVCPSINKEKDYLIGKIDIVYGNMALVYLKFSQCSELLMRFFIFKLALQKKKTQEEVA